MSSNDRPNVLFIMADQHSASVSRCYGHDIVRTPNIDRLASEGVLFTRHFVQVPTCGASRYALLTGRSPARSSVAAGFVGWLYLCG